MAGVRAAQPMSITPRRFVATVDGGASIAHTAYLGWSKPVAYCKTKAGTSCTKQKTDLVAQQPCGPVHKSATGKTELTRLPRQSPRVVLPTYVDPPPPTKLHLPRGSVMRGGSSLSKSSPTVVKLDRAFRHTFGSDASEALSPYRGAGTGGGSKTRHMKMKIGDGNVPSRSRGGQTHSMLLTTAAGEKTAAWTASTAPRIQVHENDISSPRMHRLLQQHPSIHLDRTPARSHASLQPIKPTLGAYATPYWPYNPEFLWLNTDPSYKYRDEVQLSPRTLKQNGLPPTIHKLNQPNEWDKDNYAHSRDFVTKQHGNPRVRKLECTQSGFFDPHIVSTDREEWCLNKALEDKRLGFQDGMQKGRRELAALMMAEHQVLVEEQLYGIETFEEAEEQGLLAAAAGDAANENKSTHAGADGDDTEAPLTWIAPRL